MQMTHKLTSCVIREMPIKTTRPHHTAIRMATIQNPDVTKCWQDAEPQEPSVTAAGDAERSSPLEESLLVSYKTKYGLTI